MKKVTIVLWALALTLGAVAQRPDRQGIHMKGVNIVNRNALERTVESDETAARQKMAEPKVSTFTLSNGLRVVVAEDHSEPKVFGSVIVHAGSKNEDTAATGVAHYFEHIMFKGTDKIGTTDWTSERRYLDSISDAYDRLKAVGRNRPVFEGKDAKKRAKEQAAAEEALRHEIQLEINRLNIAASKFAIANETDAILQQMGCTGLNAGTTYDYTVYYNMLPSNQLENWMEVYAERFRNPVYRLFQGELEAVYEERNIYNNDLLHDFSRNIFVESFGEHPYSRDIIGLDEHLKNPQPSAMKKFYDKYYVASNMTLLLVGDVDSRQAHDLAEKYFSIWPRGRRAQQPRYQLPKFESQVVREVKQTPLKAGLMIFPGVNSGHRDELALTLMSQLLSGSNGSLDRLATDGRVMAASLQPLTLNDAGTNIIVYIPKLLGQKHVAAEELIWQCIDSIQRGLFSDELLEGIKMRMSVERKRKLESVEGIAYLMEELLATGSSYERWQRDCERLQTIGKREIMDVARRYFDRDHCTIVRSSMGLPEKSVAIKPDWDHLEAQNLGAQSPFARHIAAREVKPIEPQKIDFRSDVRILPLTRACNLYASPNPKNDLFSLTLAYHYGTADNRDIEVAADYFNRIGAANMDLQQYNIALDRLGGSFSVSTSYDYTYFTIEGPEDRMDEIMQLVMRKLHHPRHDNRQLSIMAGEMEAAKEAAKNDPDTWFSALREYVAYGKQSTFLDHTTVKDLKKMKGENLLALLEQIFKRDGYVTYVGNGNVDDLAQMLRKENLVHQTVATVPQRVRSQQLPSSNTVFYVDNSQFLKSDIALLIPSRDFDYRTDRAAAALFNEYMGGGMNSVFFQEIREFRALGYHTYGVFSYDRFNRNRSTFLGYLGTQCDKTNDGIAAMRELMLQFPERKQKFLPAKEYLLSTRNSNYIGFRQLPSQVRYWREVEKCDADPRQQMTGEVMQLNYNNLRDFHQKYVEGRPMIILLSGNSKKYDRKFLSQYGDMKQVKYKDMIKW